MSIRKRSENTWEIQLYLGRDPVTGQTRRAFHQFEGTRKEAEADERRLRRELDLGTYAEPSRLTVGEYLAIWMRDDAKPNVSPTTYEGYNNIVAGHITPHLGAILLTKLRPTQIKAFYAAKQEVGGRIDKRGGKLSGHTVLKIHRILRQALREAMRSGLIAVNPADAVKPPKRVRVEIEALSEEQTAQLLAGLKTTNLYAPVLLAASCGLRRGELLALRWQDIDLDAKPARLKVRQSLEQTKTGLRFKEPKSRTSTRELTIPHLTVETLKHHRAAQAVKRLEQGTDYHDNDLVFAAEDGSPWIPSNFSRMFHHHAHRLGFTCRLHDMRHSHATQLLRQGTDVKTISQRLGHSSTSFTLDTYVHALRGPDEDAAARFDDALETAIAKVAAGKLYGRTTANERQRPRRRPRGGGKDGQLQGV